MSLLARVLGVIMFVAGVASSVIANVLMGDFVYFGSFMLFGTTGLLQFIFPNVIEVGILNQNEFKI